MEDRYPMADIAARIAETRYLFETNSNINENREVLDTFIELGQYVVNNFDIPESHKKYIYDNLKLDYTSDISTAFNKKLHTDEGWYNTDLASRAIEVYFSWGEKKESDYDHKIIKRLKHLINKYAAATGKLEYNE